MPTDRVGGSQRVRKKSLRTRRSGAKAPTHFRDLAARLKSGPSQNLRESSFFRSLLGHVDDLP